MDFILNGAAHGDVAGLLMQNNMDPGVMRPFLGTDGRTYVTVHKNGVPEVKCISGVVQNSATLRREDWKVLDEAIVKAAKPRLRAVSDLRGAGLTYSIPNGMGKTVLETETQSDVNEAIISMDGMRESVGDRPVFDITHLPLPIIHKDFHFSLRQIMASRNGGSPLDTTMAELAGRRVAEQAEQLLLGTANSYSYGGGTIYGYTNFPSRNTQTLQNPTGSSWVPADTVDDILAMKLKSQNDYHFGPWMVYCSTDWDVYMDADYSSAKGDNTLRDRIKKIDGITDVRTLDYLPTKTILLVQMTSDVIRQVIGMDITTLQWESKGGMQLNFKVMAILVPQTRADFNGNCGIVHGSYS